MKKSAIIILILLISRESKSQWIKVESNNSIALYSIFFPSENIGYAVGGTEGMSNNQVILKTTNKGLNWNTLISTESSSLKSVFFPSNDTGYAVGNYGLILKTENAGLNWSPQISGTTFFLNSVFFIDNFRGYVVGNYGTILKTNDGGKNWAKINFAAGNPDLHSVFFTDSTTGYAVGSNSNWGSEKVLILKTSDAGINWITQWSDTTVISYYSLFSIVFTDTATGFVVGANDGMGMMLRTSNGGIEWVESQEDYYMTSVCFPTKDTGYAVGNFTTFKTIDGGVTWASHEFNLDSQSGLWRIYFTNSQTGYTINGHGDIFMTTNGSEPTNVFELNNGNKNILVYPNPVIDNLYLETTLKIKGSILTIYDISGQEIIKLELKDNKTTIPFQNAESGLYLLKIENDKTVMIRKIIKV
jgi:photosystem II stability/assembly factor-like uncharacterized protein